MPKKPTSDESQRRVAGLEAQQQLLTEIANRKRAEEGLHQSEARLKHALEIADVGCWEWDIKTGTLLWSEQTYRQMGEQPDQCSPNRDTFLQYVHPADRAAFATAMDETLAGRSYFDLEFRIVRSNGGIRILHSRGEVVRSPDGLPLSMFGVSTDITERKRAEEELQEKERLLQTIIDGSTSPIFLKDLDGKFITINASLERMLGISREEIKGKTDYDIASKEVADYWRTHDKQVMATHKAIQIEEVADLQDGHHIFLANKFPLLDVDGQTYGLAAISHDITERKLAEEALRESENRFRSVVESMSEGLMLFDMDGNLIYQNPASLRIHGFGDPETGRVDRTDLPSRWEGFDENGSPLQFEDWPIYRVFRRHERFQNQVVRARRVDTGKEFFASYNGSPIYDPDGKPVLGFITIRDITESKQAEEALQESEERKRAAEMLASSEKEFRLLAEAMPQIVWTTRADGWNNYFNHQWVDYTGLTLEESYGHGWNKPFHPEDQPRAWDAWQNAVTNRASYALECRLRRSDGVYRWWLIRGVPVLDERGKILKWFGTCTDIEDIKRAEESLRRANADLEHRATQLRALAGELTLSEQRERSRLAKILHDHLQQLLVAAKFRLTILSRGADDVLKQATKEIEGLIDESIASSRSLTAELSPPILHEGGLIAGLEWLSRRMADTQGLLVDLELQEIGPLPDDLKIMLFESARELLFNVSKHAHTRSSAVSLKRVDGFLQLTVSDQGEGFDPNVTLRGGSGTGFGLFSVRERLKLFGGRLEVQSAPGQGSRVFISVPIAQQTVQPAAPDIVLSSQASSSESVLKPAPGTKIRVLVADDHAVVRQGIGNMLSDEPDIEIVGLAADGQEAVDLAAKLLPNAILMDMSMPKLNGVEATRIIHNEYPEICIIGLSMFEEAERAQAMRDAGAVNYLTKSGPAEDLINAIRTSVGACNKRRSAKSPS